MMYGSWLLSFVGAFIPRYTTTVLPDLDCYEDVQLLKYADDVFFNILYCMMLDIRQGVLKICIPDSVGFS